jgi:hypothetical protein
VWRGLCGRRRAQRCRTAASSAAVAERSALLLQKLFRGHKGREHAECTAALRAVESRARCVYYTVLYCIHIPLHYAYISHVV